MIPGIDVSKWQKKMDWQLASDAGAKFAFIRAGSCEYYSGDNYTDYQFERNAAMAPDVMPVGYYWYFRPQHDPIAQANYFCDLIEDKDWDLPPVMDMESTGGLSSTAVSNSAGQFIAQVYARVKVWPLVYSRAAWLNRYTIDHPLFHECDLWIARYKSTLTHPWGDAELYPNLKPKNWNDWKFWQFSSSGHGAEYGAESASIDRNWFNGDEAAFQEYLGVPPPQVELPPSIGVKIDVDGVKYRGHINKVE